MATNSQARNEDLVGSCFIVGCERSGTTLLSVVLDRHSQLAIPPETGFYKELSPRIDPTNRETLETLLSQWRRVAELGLTPHAIVDECAGDHRPAVVLRSMLALFARRRGKVHCGEKTPVHRRYVKEILSDFPNARILHIFRDGRDVALSLLETPWWNASLMAAADFWLDAVADLRSLEAQYPTRFMAVRLESLLATPAAVLAPIMTFLDLEFEPRQLDSTLSSGVVLARSLAWKGKALDALEADWPSRRRRTLSPEQAERLEARLHHQLRQLDYV